MKKFLLFLASCLIASSCSHTPADRSVIAERQRLFSVLLAQHNAGTDMPLLSEPIREWYNYTFPPGQRGKVALLSEERWHGDKGLARISFERGEEYFEGWLAADVDVENRIEFVTWTSDAPAGIPYLVVAGQGADMLTTGIALGAGFTEANPIVAQSIGILGFAGTAVLKVAAIGYTAYGTGLGRCMLATKPTAAMGWGAAGWNIGTMAGFGWGAAAPALMLVLALWPNDNEVFWGCLPRPLVTWAEQEGH